MKDRPALRLGDPFGGLQRDHRKLVVVDGEIAYVGGMCVGVEWAGTATEAPWRDTGLEIRGPAAHTAARQYWAGAPLWSKANRRAWPSPTSRRELRVSPTRSS